MLGKKREPDNVLVRETYNRVRNRVNREIKRSKKDHHKSYFEATGGGTTKCPPNFKHDFIPEIGGPVSKKQFVVIFSYLNFSSRAVFHF